MSNKLEAKSIEQAFEDWWQKKPSDLNGVAPCEISEEFDLASCKNCRKTSLYCQP